MNARRVWKTTVVLVGTASVALACGRSGSDEDDPHAAGSEETSPRFATLASADPYANDPPPKWCGVGSAPPPSPITGSEFCPSDKNKPGCPCESPGETASCWTGLRRHRALGVCRDGVTTCKQTTETLNAWGECEGEVLPTAGARGREGCGCFSRGEWKIRNTAPCLRTGTQVTAMSTVYTTEPSSNCGLNDGPLPAPGVPPPGTWSPSSLKVDCAGKFRLCFKIRAGRYESPRTSDCVLGESCVDADVSTPDVEQALPPLPTWAGTDPACAKRWEVDTPPNESPGYGELIVQGATLACDKVDDGAGNAYVFHRIQYCPRMCRGGANAAEPACVACQLAGRGVF